MALKLKVTKTVIKANPKSGPTYIRRGTKEELNEFASAATRLEQLWTGCNMPVEEAQRDLKDLIEAMFEGKKIPTQFRVVLQNLEKVSSLDEIIKYAWNLKLAAEGLGLNR